MDRGRSGQSAPPRSSAPRTAAFPTSRSCRRYSLIFAGVPPEEIATAARSRRPSGLRSRSTSKAGGHGDPELPGSRRRSTWRSIRARRDRGARRRDEGAPRAPRASRAPREALATPLLLSARTTSGSRRSSGGRPRATVCRSFTRSRARSPALSGPLEAAARRRRNLELPARGVQKSRSRAAAHGDGGFVSDRAFDNLGYLAEHGEARGRRRVGGVPALRRERPRAWGSFFVRPHGGRNTTDGRRRRAI